MTIVIYLIFFVLAISLILFLITDHDMMLLWFMIFLICILTIFIIFEVFFL